MEGVLISLITSYLSAAAEWDQKGLFGGRRRVFMVDGTRKGCLGPGEGFLLWTEEEGDYAGAKGVRGAEEESLAAIFFQKPRGT